MRKYYWLVIFRENAASQTNLTASSPLLLYGFKVLWQASDEKPCMHTLLSRIIKCHGKFLEKNSLLTEMSDTAIFSISLY